jgi:hypothetical protein
MKKEYAVSIVCWLISIAMIVVIAVEDWNHALSYIPAFFAFAGMLNFLEVRSEW